MKSRSLCTMTNLRRSLIVVWGLSLLLAAPVLYTKVSHFSKTFDKELIDSEQFWISKLFCFLNSYSNINHYTCSKQPGSCRAFCFLKLY